MTTPCDSRHVPQYLDKPRPESCPPEAIEYYDNESESDSDFTITSSEESCSLPSPPSPSVLRGGVRSFGDLRGASKQRKSRQRSPSHAPIRPLHPAPTASELGDRTEASPAGVAGLCENCLGMSADNLTQPGGYKHSMSTEFFKSMKWCKFCKKLQYRLKMYRLMECPPDRYQIVASLKCGSPMGHGNSNFNDQFSRICFDVIDLSWESPNDDIENMSKIPHTGLPPDASKLRTVESDSRPCLTEEHDPATEFGVGYIRQVGSDTSSSRSHEIAAGWLASCLSAKTTPKLKDWKPAILGDGPPPYSGHEAGGSKAIALEGEAVSLPAPQDPLRLVEIQSGTKGSAPTLRLIHTDGQHYQYAALSYCWGTARPGDSRPWQTREATLKKHLQGIDRGHLPQTLQDAISICEKLGILYLWVDSLCIIQDSPSDWAAEAAKMSGVYLGSLLTVSLSASVSVEAGCLNRVSQPIVEFAKPPWPWTRLDTRLKDGRSSCLSIAEYAVPSKVFAREVLSGVLSQRAWALQEHIMPQRTLYVTSKGLFWECRHCRLSEDNYPQRQTDWLYPICDYGFPLDATATIEMWYRRVVEDYTRRQITYEEDKLVAISALARATYLNRHIGYVAGLWRDCIVPGLLWMRSSRAGRKSRTYSCPTWSWASQTSAVTYKEATPSPHLPTIRTSENFPRVQDVSWDARPENPFGDVFFAHVDLDTTIALGTVLRDNTFTSHATHRLPLGEYQQTLVIPGPGRNGPLLSHATMDDADEEGRNVVVANMGHCFLLLEPPSLDSKEYRRVGIAVIYRGYSVKGSWDGRMDDITRGWTRRTIRLV